MNADIIQLKEEKFKKALAALERIAYLPMQIDNMNIDAVIQRFEFTIELFWKWLKAILEYQKVTARTPREVFSECFIAGYITNEKIWLALLDDRNMSSHTYNESAALELFTKIQNEYVPLFKQSYIEISARVHTVQF